MDNVILIPVLNPTNKLLELIRGIKDKFKYIVVINDGSKKECNDIFEKAKSMDCVIITHEKNKGKGAAIKTGMRYVLDNIKDALGIITVDGDGQHIPEDIFSIDKVMKETDDTNCLILGIRNFNDMNVPSRSRLGNKFSSIFFKLTTGEKCPDTQTGLRGIKRSMFELALNVDGDRYDYEMNFLFLSVRNKIKLIYVPIHTVYEDNNKESHFRPILDSIRIYKEPIRFLISSIICAIIDISLFSLLALLFSKMFNIDLSNPSAGVIIISSTIIARIFSGVLNFNLNKKWSFKSKEISNEETDKSDFSSKKEFTKYLSLFIVQMMISAFAVYVLSMLFGNKNIITLLKLIVDITLFVLSYFIQRKYIFRT